MKHFIFQLLNAAITCYILAVLARVIASWCQIDPRQGGMRLLARLTDPVLAGVSRIVPVRFGNVDFSPALLLVALSFLQRLLRLLLY